MIYWLSGENTFEKVLDCERERFLPLGNNGDGDGGRVGSIIFFSHRGVLWGIHQKKDQRKLLKWFWLNFLEVK